MSSSEFAVLVIVGLISSGCIIFWVRRKVRLCFNSLAGLRQEVASLGQKAADCQVELAKLLKSNQIVAATHWTNKRQHLPILRSQFGEDLVLLEFFGTQSKGFFVEAGGFDGLTFSATLVLESLGWTGLLVEPHPQLFLHCKANRPGASVIQAALGASGESGETEFTCVDYGLNAGSPLSFRAELSDQQHIERCRSEGASFRATRVPLTTLNAALKDLTDRVDVLILDIEGHEVQVLSGFDISRYSPSVVIVEIHWNDQDQVLREWFAEREYQSCGVIGCNEFFSPTDSSKKLRSLIQAFPRF